jgi:glutamyl-tRNA synthetase
MKIRDVRVRFAPSPTGPLHIGGVRTALYNFLFARKYNGSFILRIEDTDRNRYVPGSEQYILDSLSWCGIRFDEGIREGGPYAPYRQSDRMSIYREFAYRLVEKGHAYYAFDTQEELENARNESLAHGQDQFQYNYRTRPGMKNSLSLSSAEINRRIQRGDPYVVRILIPENQTVIFDDLIRDEVSVNTGNLDDKVLFKSDGLPTYHLANVVDDYLMKITHVIRGEEWLPSAPMHLLLYRFFEWEDVMPEFAHLPLILKPDGNGKLSKRDGQRLGFPVYPLEWKDPSTGESYHGYREDGFLPDAFINMLALLGWHPGTDREIFPMDELIHSFSLDRINKSGARFDPDKAKWFNHQYLSKMGDEELAGILLQLAVPPGRDLRFAPIGGGQSMDIEYCKKVVHLIKERAFLLTDLWKNAWFFFMAPETFDEETKAKYWMPDTGSMINGFSDELHSLETFNKNAFHAFVQDFVKRRNIKTGQLMNPLRLLVVGSSQGPGLMDIAETLGKDEFLSRLRQGLEKINSL